MSAKMKEGMLALFAVALMMVGLDARADVPAAVGTAFTAVVTDATSVAGYAYTAILGVLGLILVAKLIKRFGNKI